MSFKKMSLALIGILLLGAWNISVAQSKADAIKAYNEALEIAKAGNYMGAVTKMNECIEICDKIGSEGDDTKSLAQRKLPGFYYQEAVSIYKDKRIEESIAAFEVAEEIAEKYGDSQIQQKSSKIIPQLYYNVGMNQFKRSDFDAAMENLTKASELNPRYAKAFYGKGLIYKNKDDLEGMTDAMDKAIQYGLETNDSKIVREAEEAMRDYMVFRGAKLTEQKSYDEALALLQKALIYDKEHADTYYRLAEVYNKLSRFNEAISQATKALTFEKGGKSESAKIYFELGLAYKFLKNKERACEAFQNAAFGQFTQSANYEIEHELKCGSSDPY